jgi:hypothetical protein
LASINLVAVMVCHSLPALSALPMASNPQKSKAESSTAQNTDQPVKQCCGTPPKSPNKPKDTIPKLTLKIPSHSDKSTSPKSNSDSEVIETTEHQSSISIDNNNDNLDLLQAATEGLLGLFVRNPTNNNNNNYYNGAEQQEDKEQEQEEEDEEEEDENFGMWPASSSMIIFRI